ncbi:MAG: AAA family ATPase [Octadecabacter sp.]
MSDDNIIHFNPWTDFNDAAIIEDPFGVEPDAAQIATFLDVVFGYSDNMIPVRGFVDKGQGKDGKPHNIWIDADDTAPEKLATFAKWAWKEGAAVYVIPGTVAENGQAKSADVLQMQAIIVDLDAGDIPAKLDHLVSSLGQPTLIVESGGRTKDGANKLHVWWKLTEVAEGEDLARLCKLRGEIAIKVGGDTHFRSAHQPIRVAGSVYHKYGFQRVVQIRQHNEVEVDLADFGERVGEMSAIPGVGMTPTSDTPDKPALGSVLTNPVHEGGADDWSRFEGASAAIGHFIRMVHEGRMTPGEGWQGICGYNAAMLRPSWPEERLKTESDRLWVKHVEKNGPPLLRTNSANIPPEMSAFKLGELLDDTRPMPADIISPRVLTPGGLLVLGGAPKVGKSDFLISWLVHMAAGVPFLGFTPPRPLRVFYLQAEIQYHYLRERLKQIALPPEVIAAARDTFVATPKLKLLLDEHGSAMAAAAVKEAFPNDPVDILCIDPIRNVFDGGPDGGGENDNGAMMFFLRDRVEVLREAINPDCGVILVHHTKKLGKHQVKEDPFLALSGASSLRGFYTSGLIMHRPDEEASDRKLEIELRNGPALPSKLVDKVKGQWVELNPMNERLVRKDVGGKHDAERVRKGDVIIQMIAAQAARGKMFTLTQFSRKFENKGSLGGKTAIGDRLHVLATKGHVKFVRGKKLYELGLKPTSSKFGYICVRNMRLKADAERMDKETGEIISEAVAVQPSDYMCPESGALLPVENSEIWVDQEEDSE